MRHLIALLALLSLAGTRTWTPPHGIRAIIGNNMGDNDGYLMATGTDFYLMFGYEFTDVPLCLASNVSPPFYRPLYPDVPTTWWWHLSGTKPGDLIQWACRSR